MKTLTEQDLRDILNGAAVLGGGGGGQISEGERCIKKALSASSTFRLASLNEVGEDDFICFAYRIGPVFDPEEAGQATFSHLARKDSPIVAAHRLMEQKLGKTISGIVSVEIGSVNTLLPFALASSIKNGVVLDADPVGRSVPGLEHCRFWSLDVPPRQIVAADGFGQTYLLEDIENAQHAEKELAALGAKGNGCLYGIDNALPKKLLAPVLGEGSVSKALSIGKHLRKAKEHGDDIAETLANTHSGMIVFRGFVTKVVEREEHRYTVGEFHLKGLGNFDGHSYRIMYRNENLVGWLDDEVNVTVPEIITLIGVNGDVILNHAQKIGDEAAVVVLPAPQYFLTAEGLRLFGPSYCGLTHEFRSVLDS